MLTTNGSESEAAYVLAEQQITPSGVVSQIMLKMATGPRRGEDRAVGLTAAAPHYCLASDSIVTLNVAAS